MQAAHASPLTGYARVADISCSPDEALVRRDLMDAFTLCTTGQSRNNNVVIKQSLLQTPVRCMYYTACGAAELERV